MVRYLDRNENLALVHGMIVVLVLVVVLGFWIFRGENESDDEDEQTGHQGRALGKLVAWAA